MRAETTSFKQLYSSHSPAAVAAADDEKTPAPSYCQFLPAFEWFHHRCQRSVVEMSACWDSVARQPVSWPYGQHALLAQNETSLNGVWNDRRPASESLAGDCLSISIQCHYSSHPCSYRGGIKQSCDLFICPVPVAWQQCISELWLLENTNRKLRVISQTHWLWPP